MSLVVAPSARASTPPAPRDFTWDIVRVSMVGGTLIVDPGGTALAMAGGPTVRLTGTGEFEIGTSSEADGEGTFVFVSGTVTTSGSYEVTGFVSWAPADGSLTLAPFPVIDNVGDIENSHAGVLLVTIHLDGVGDATLGIHCSLPGTSASIEEGVSLVVGGTAYSQVAGMGFTVFHSQ